MKRTMYHIVMDDGHKLDIEEQSAGVAIQSSLRAHPCHRVVECRAGLTEDEAMELRQNGIDKMAKAGLIYFDVPPHESMDLDVALQPAKIKKQDHTALMFSVEEMAGGKLDKAML